MKVSYGTDVGMIRSDNQDSVFSRIYSDNIGLFIVADGMGGYEGGQLASSHAVSCISEYMQPKLENFKYDDICQLLRQAVSKANKEIYDMSLNNTEYLGMGTTVVVCVLIDDTLYTASVGDSRAYVFSKNSLKQITNDHSLVADLLMRGLITKSEAKKHPQKNVITRAVGSEQDVKTDIFVNTIKKNDIIFMCSDGLHNMLNDNEIKKIIKCEHKDTAQMLISKANENGGRDNISVITVKMNDEEK